MPVRRFLALALLCAGAGAGCATVRPLRAAPVPRLALDERDRVLAEALARYARGLVSEGESGWDNPETLRQFEAAIRLDPGRPELYLRLAAYHIQRGQPAKAVELLQRARRKNPRHAATRLNLGTAYEACGRLREAAAEYRAAARLDPSEAAPYVRLASLLFNRKSDRRAAAWLERGMRRADNTGDVVAACCAFGAQFVAAKQGRRAVACFEPIARAEPARRSEFYEFFGDLCDKVGDERGATHYYEEAARGTPPRADPFLKLADAYGRRDADKATRAIRAGLRLLPEEPRLLFALGFLLVADERFDEAVEAFEKTRAAVRASGDGTTLNDKFYFYYGMACERAHRTEAAVAAFETGISQYPESAEMINYVAYMWAEAGTNLDVALDYAARALQLDADNGAYVDTLGWIWFKQGRTQEALEELLRALSLLGDDPTVADHIGDAYRALGDNANAKLYWTRSFVLDPATPGVAAKLEAAGADLRALRRESRRRQKEEAAASEEETPAEDESQPEAL
jgi:tetratricopeptide (TPR) repeat protein